MTSDNKERLESLDILRGSVLWLLLMVGPVASAIRACCQGPWVDIISIQTLHPEWYGFVLWDIIMPLFMFMSGVTIPFSMAKYKNGTKVGKSFYLKLLKRFCLLFFLGWLVQGRLLDLDVKLFHPYANTLQAIAVGYVFSSLIFVHLGRKSRIAATALFFIAYFLVFAIGDSLHPDQIDNIAMNIDKAVLGSHRDGVVFSPCGSWGYHDGYKYTWILSSLNFTVTVMLGCFCGEILKSTRKKKGLILATFGAILLGAGLVMNPIFPIIKKIWSSSFVLFAGGISALALALSYYIIDVHRWKKGLGWLKYFGMNSIAAYCIGEIVDFSSATESLLFGFEHILGVYYPILIAFANTLVLFFILKFMYDRKIFLRA